MALTHHYFLISSTLGFHSEGLHITMVLHLSVCYHIVLRLTDAPKHSLMPVGSPKPTTYGVGGPEIPLEY